MTCYIRMKRIFLQGLIWLYLLGFGFMAVSLEPGFLDFDNLPDTNFSCVGKVIGGYYADLETNCQMFHVCTIGQLEEPMDIRFLCLNGTVFDQETRVCERIDEVDCSKSEQFYSLNLELYGNTQPAILEESPETEQPLLIKSTTTTTTTTQAPRPKTSRTPYYTTITSPTVTTASNPQVISTHHFPVGSSPDIRFNPEEINISLHPGAPPDIRTKPVTFHQQSYSDNNKKVVVTTHSENSDNKKVTVTTHSAVFDEDKVLPNQEQGLIERPQVKSSTQKPHSGHGYGHSHSSSNKKFNHPTPSDINYEFGYHQTEPSREYHTDIPQNYHYQSNFRPSQEYSGHHNPHSQQFKSSTYQNEYTPTTSKVINNYQQKTPTTLRNYFSQSLKPPPPNQHHYAQPRSESPQRLQLPLPLLPTLPTLTFSSPAPFSLQHHIETKRYTKDHQAPPRIIISASASVSDASGRRLNYSLGTIGAAEILEQPPHSYDEYKDDDVGLDPFYHDVPKLKHSRRKRAADAKIKHSDIIRNEQEAVDVLKFLFDWYKNNEKTATESTTIPTITLTDPISPELITQINDELTSIVSEEEIGSDGVSKETSDDSFHKSDLFNRNSKYSIIGNKSNDENQKESKINPQKEEMSVENINTNQNMQLETIIPSQPSGNFTNSKDFVDELFRHEEDYVNDNFEPIAYSELYGKNQHNYVKENTSIERTKPLAEEEEKHKSISGHQDDHIKPIYFRPSTENVNSTEKEINLKEKLLMDIFENDTESEANIEVITPVTSEQHLTTEHSNVFEKTETIGSTDKSLKQLNQTGDIETNNINKKEETNLDILSSPNESTTVKTIVFSSTEVTYNTEPKSEILEVTTTGKTTSTNRSRSDRRRGRRRFHKTNDKEKELDSKHVVLEKITEKAHTAKDDFNYLRTLYKVHSTTPMSSVSTSEEIKNKIRNKANKVEPSNSEEEKEDNFDVRNIGTKFNEQFTDITTEANVLSVSDNNFKEAEDIVPIATTEEAITSTTKKPRKDERRRGRGRSRYNNNTSQKPSSRRIHHGRRKSTTPVPIEQAKKNGTSNSESNDLQSPNNIGEIVDRQNSAKLMVVNLNREANHAHNMPENDTDTNKDNTIEKHSSNISSSFVPYSEIIDITTEYTKTLAEEPKNFTVVDSNRFLNQLTINYKKLFEDIIKSNDSVVSVEEHATPPYASTESLKLVEENKVKEISTTNKSVHEEESEDNSPHLTLASSDAVYVPHVEKQENPTTTSNHLEIIETQETGSPSTNLSELYTEAIQEGFLVTTSKNIIPNLENHSIISQDISAPEGYHNIEAGEVSKSRADISTIELSTEKLQETTTLIQEIITETPKHFETSSTENTQIVDKISVTQQTTNGPIEEIVLAKKEDGQVVANISTTQLTTEHLQENNYLYITSTQSNDEIPKLEARELDIISTTQRTTDRINTAIFQGTEYYPSPLIQEIDTTENNNNLDVKPENQFTEEMPTTQLTTERTPKITEQVEVTTESTVAVTDISLNNESKIGEIEHFNNEVTTITNTENHASETIGRSNTKEPSTATEKVEHLEDLINKIQTSTKSQIATTITPKLTTSNVEFSKQEIGGVEVLSALELTTLRPSEHYEEKITTTQTPVVTETESLPINQLESLTTTERPVTTTEQLLTATEQPVTATEQPVTTEKIPITTVTTRETTTISRRGNRRGTRPARRRTTNNFNRSTTRHRFSTEIFTRRPGRRRTTIEEQIVDELTRKSYESTTKPLRNINYSNNNRIRNEVVEEFATDAPLHKSVSPTQAERVRESLPTTPFSKTKNIRRFYIFNCFGKEVDKFYPDPRDCRLFHYCTQGYNKNQLLDMKFVCDLNTYFDDEKLICTKRKPRRCL